MIDTKIEFRLVEIMLKQKLIFFNYHVVYPPSTVNELPVT